MKIMLFALIFTSALAMRLLGAEAVESEKAVGNCYKNCMGKLDDEEECEERCQASKETAVAEGPGYVSDVHSWESDDLFSAYKPHRSLPRSQFQWLVDSCTNGYTTKEARYKLWGSHTFEECKDQGRAKEAVDGSGTGTGFSYYNGQCYILNNPKKKDPLDYKLPEGRSTWLTCAFDERMEYCDEMDRGCGHNRNIEETAEMKKLQNSASNFPNDRHQQECWTNGGCTKEANQACDYCGLHNGKEQFCCKWAGKGACTRVFGTDMNPKLPPGRSHVCAVSRDSRDMRIVDKYKKECWTTFGCRDSDKPCAACGYHNGSPMWCRYYPPAGQHRCLTLETAESLAMVGSTQSSGLQTTTTYGLAAVGFAAVVYGAGKHYFGK